MARDKTETIKQRAIYVYTPTEQVANAWKKAADKAGMSISKFIFETVEDHLHSERGLTSKSALVKQVQLMKEQNERLRQETLELQRKVDMLTTLTERYESLLQDYRNKTFIENGKFTGVREYQKDLIELFKKKKSVSEDELIDLLHIDPRDTTTLKAISKQIENLEEYGVVQKIRGGWRWKK